MERNLRIGSRIATACLLAALSCESMDGAVQPIGYAELNHKPSILQRYTYTDANAPSFFLKAYAEVADDAARSRQVRNEILLELMAIIDDYWGRFAREFHARHARRNFRAETAVLTLNAATTVVGSELAKSLMAATATVLQGSNAAFDRNFLASRAAPAVVKQMQANRAFQEARIRTAMARGVADYPLVDGLRDILAYYHAGTVIDALQRLDAQASRTQRQAERIVEVKRGVAIPRSESETENLLANLDALQDVLSLFQSLLENGALDDDELWELHHAPPVPDTEAAQVAIRSRFPGSASRKVDGYWRVAERHLANVRHAVVEQIQNTDPTPQNLARWNNALSSIADTG